MIDISQSRNDTERKAQMHAIIDAYLDAFRDAKDKDAFVSGFLCAVVDILQPNVVNGMIADSLRFSNRSKEVQ